MDCGFECHMIGGPWIAENPSCPIHGVNGRDFEEEIEDLQSVNELLKRRIEILEGAIENALECDDSTAADDILRASVKR